MAEQDREDSLDDPYSHDSTSEYATTDDDSDEYFYPWNKPRPCSARHWTYRYVILFLVCIVKFAQNYVYEIPTGMEKTIVQTLNVDVTRYSLLFSVYSWPNIVLPLMGGVLVDRVIGIRVGTMLFMCISVIGQLLFSLGGYFDSFVLMVVSRFFVGVGSQMSLVISDAFASRWFKGKEIGLMFALIGIACRLGGIAGIYCTSVIYDWLDFVEDSNSQLGYTLMVSFGVLSIATATTLLLVILDKRGRRSIEESPSYNKAMPRGCDWIQGFGVQFWFAAIMFLSFFATVFSFVTTSQLFFISKFQLSTAQANAATIVSYAIPVFAPVVGFIIDQVGFYISWGLFGGLGIMFGGHVLFCFSSDYTYIPFLGNVLIGISYICFNTAMRAVPTVLVSENQLVTAFGILESFQSMGYSVTDIVVGVLIDGYGYFVQEIFLMCLVLAGIVAGTLLVFCVRSSNANKSKLKSCRRRDSGNGHLKSY